MPFIKKHPLLIVFIGGLLLRFFLLFLDFSFDVHNHISWAKDLSIRGSSDFYLKVSSEVFGTKYPNYPPFILFVFYLLYLFADVLHDVAWWMNLQIPLFPSSLIFFMEGRPFLAGIMKLPALFADLGIAWLIVLFAKKLAPKDKNLPLLGAVCILFNPTFFYNSAYWGQVDAIPLFFTMWAVYIIFVGRQYLLSSILLTTALLMKPTILLFFPIYGYFFWQKFGMKKGVQMVVLSNIIFWIAFLPFVSIQEHILNPYVIFKKQILDAQSLPYITNAAFNFWILIAQLKGVRDTEIFLFNLTYQTWGFMITGFLYAIILYYYVRWKNDVKGLFFAAFLMAFSAFLFLTKMHERYYILPLPFLLILCLKDKSYFKWFYVLSALSFLNLYHSWSVPRIDWFVNILTHPSTYTTLSILNLLVYLYLLRDFIFLSLKKKNRRRLQTEILFLDQKR